MLAVADAGFLSGRDARAIVELLGRVSEDGGGRPNQRKLLMDGLCDLVHADCWVWGVFEFVSEGALPGFAIQQSGGFSRERLAKYLRANEHRDLGPISAPLFELARREGRQITRMRQQTDPNDSFAQSGAYALWADADVSPGILSLRPTDTPTIGFMSVYRRMAAPLYTEREARIAHIVLTEIPWLHENDSTGSDLPWDRLGPRHVTITNLLLAGFTRGEIAGRLGLSPHTIGGYVKEIYASFGVTSQPALMRRFFEGDGADGLHTP